LSPWELVRLEWSEHALERVQQRSIEPGCIQAVLWFGRKLASKTGRILCRLDPEAISAARCAGVPLEGQEGLTVVLQGNIIITAFWK
jgi:hypothetical protein